MKKSALLVRKNIQQLKPYSSARDEFKGEASVYLDANENPYNTPNNRYPDPLQQELKAFLAPMKGVDTAQIFTGNGSDEAIDLCFRAFCEPRIDNVVAIDPTYGMYRVCAEINDVEYRSVLLNHDFQFSATSLLDAADANTKLIFLCSPNNPTGNSLEASEIERLLSTFDGIVILDEAYIDFSSQPSFLQKLSQYPNLILLQTFSKAWGSAAIRLGMAFASPEIIAVFNKIKYPYNVNRLTQLEGFEMLKKAPQIEQWIEETVKERDLLIAELEQIPFVLHIFPSDANFILVKTDHAKSIYDYLANSGIIVRNRSTISLCQECLRITIGSKTENRALLTALKKYNLQTNE